MADQQIQAPPLPVEVITNIFVQSIQDKSVCAFKVFIPEWRLCERPYRQFENSVRCTRADTYITPIEGGKCGQVSTTFDHCSQDHLYFPIIPDSDDHPKIDPYFDGELLTAYLRDSLIVINQEKQSLRGIADFVLYGTPPDMRLLRSPLTRSLLPYADDFQFPLTYRRRLPPDPSRHQDEQPCEPRFQYEEITNLVLNANPYINRFLPQRIEQNAWPNDLNRHEYEQLSLKLELEKCSHFYVNFPLMARLETLFIDARQFSRDEIPLELVQLLANSLSKVKLKLLVIAGLRSFTKYPGGDSLTLEDVAQTEDPMIGEPNFFSMFTEALRPGGKLILVDRAADEIALLYPEVLGNAHINRFFGQPMSVTQSGLPRQSSPSAVSSSQVWDPQWPTPSPPQPASPADGSPSGSGSASDGASESDDGYSPPTPAAV